MIAALIFGLAPALRGSRLAPQEGLRDGGRGTAGGRSHWFRHSLIIVETALAVLLLTCGGLLLQTFQHLRNTDLGMRTERLLTFETPLFRYKDFDRRVAFVNAEVEKVRAIPGVISAGSISVIPFTNFANATFYKLEGQPTASVAGQVALVRNVSRDYFATVGARLREGQGLQRVRSKVRFSRGDRERAVCESPLRRPVAAGPTVQVRVFRREGSLVHDCRRREADPRKRRAG